MDRVILCKNCGGVLENAGACCRKEIARLNATIDRQETLIKKLAKKLIWWKSWGKERAA